LELQAELLEIRAPRNSFDWVVERLQRLAASWTRIQGDWVDSRRTSAWVITLDGLFARVRSRGDPLGTERAWGFAKSVEGLFQFDFSSKDWPVNRRLDSMVIGNYSSVAGVETIHWEDGNVWSRKLH